ncbi:MAG: sulfatase [Planctomycetota bacterium]|nr:sulfatase [Planctomycetota bacterium]
MNPIGRIFLLVFLLANLGGLRTACLQADQPNVLLIVCDDLNDYVEGYDGHPQTKTPNIHRLSQTGVRFQQAHCNIPICGPSRASLFTGIYPHHSGCFGFTRWNTYEVLNNSRTLMEHFRANGYQTLGTGKLMHHFDRGQWETFGNRADYGPFASDGQERIAHPDVPAPYRDIGHIDGSFGPLIDFRKRNSQEGKTYQWLTGSWNNVQPLIPGAKGRSGMTADERNGQWAVNQLQTLAGEKSSRPFFMGIGFIRPHTPLVVPSRFFDMFPLDTIRLPEILQGDVADTYAHTVRGLPSEKEPSSERTLDMGTQLYTQLKASYDKPDEGLRRFIQAYLASVASVDEQVGKILDTLEATGLDRNTVVILTSDHGWGMGEKDYLYKNSLWQESTRVPLIIRAPGATEPNGICQQAVSLVDLYPTLIELCQLKGETRKTKAGHNLDGHSLAPLLSDPSGGKWSGPDSALTALYKWRAQYDPAQESYSLRSKDWRYIRYENGKEELYQTSTDPHEWTNLAGRTDQQSRLRKFRHQLTDRLNAPAAMRIPPQPAWQAQEKATTPETKKPDAAFWKDKHFKKHPEADTNGDGQLSWPEFKAHKAKMNSGKTGKET